MNPEIAPQMELARWPYPPWDPIPWWVIDRVKLERIVVVQMEGRIAAMEKEVEQLRKVREIVAGK